MRKNGEFRIRSAAIVPRTKRWDAETLAEPQSSADEMRAAASVCDRLSGGVAGVVMPMALCETAQVKTPTGHRWGRTELLRAAEAETQQSLADHVVDWWPARIKADRLNVVAAPARWSDRVSADVAAAGRHCRLIDALPWTLARAVSMVHGADAPPSAVAFEWGYDSATLCLVHERTPALVRRLKDCGYGQLVAAIQRELRLDSRDAEILLQKYGLSCPGANASCAAAMELARAEPLERLARELKRTLTYWNGQARSAAPLSMYLFGGGSSLPGIQQRVKEISNLDVRLWTLAPENPADVGRLPPAHLLGPALGLSALALES